MMYKDLLIDKDLDLKELQEEKEATESVLANALNFIYEGTGCDSDPYIKICYEQLHMDKDRLCKEMADCGMNPDEQDAMLRELGVIGAKNYLDDPMILAIFSLGKAKCLELHLISEEDWELTYSAFKEVMRNVFGDKVFATKSE